MGLKSMSTMFSNVLQQCLEPRTSAHKIGITVSTEVLAGEIIIFYHTDCKEGRKGLNAELEGNKICDYLILFTKDEVDYEIVCFLELKGKNLETAIQQIERTHQYVKDLSRLKFKKYNLNINWRVCICLRRSASNANQRKRNELIQKFGGDNVVIKHGITYFDIGPLLRKKPKSNFC